MEKLTNRMIEKYLKSSKKQKSQKIIQYCELTHVKELLLLRGLKDVRRNICLKKEKSNKIHHYMYVLAV
ncbi:hypothetical protein PW5551_00880 [Petrotoga sp. 9PW.55.5.1]|uniref:hypothetical protein n=1 Tax=Petrotoga sp. 9PW.55.5.1 TaxID=1308979 RepID=UPI000DC48E42|nr:hypothetical protein [Petrotoga sp. 9PW.55.5.1]RAO99969.1 hypothetical protein PW5551_00880 [Petrotoga sp. 9PW.55.5.1]